MTRFLLFTTLFFFTATVARSQSGIEKYCEIRTFQYGKSSADLHIEWIRGRVDSLSAFRDAAVNESLNKVNWLKTSADLLNYMSSLGWSLTGTAAPGIGRVYFYFKKTFPAPELVGNTLSFPAANP